VRDFVEAWNKVMNLDRFDLDANLRMIPETASSDVKEIVGSNG
jgi:hypothetical protein